MDIAVVGSRPRGSTLRRLCGALGLAGLFAAGALAAGPPPDGGLSVERAAASPVALAAQATGSVGAWTKIGTFPSTLRAPSWFNLAMDGQGRAYLLNWNGELVRFDGADNSWKVLGSVMRETWSAHNCTLTGEPLNNRIYLTGQCSSGGIPDPDYTSFWYWDVERNEKVTHCQGKPCGSGGPNSLGAYDPVNQRLLASHGWLPSIDAYEDIGALPLRPLAAAWQRTRVPTTPRPRGECDRLAHNRGGWDAKRNRYWIIMADGHLNTRDAAPEAPWVKRQTTGGPPNVCSVYGYHAALDLIVGWTGVDYVTGALTPMVRQTWLLDPETLVWTQGPSAAAGDTVPPGGGPTINAVGYDAARSQLLLYAQKELWAFRGTGGRRAAVQPR